MRDNDVLDNNPYISRSALEAIHEQVFAWALSRSGWLPSDWLRRVDFVDIASNCCRLSRRHYGVRAFHEQLVLLKGTCAASIGCHICIVLIPPSNLEEV